MARFSPPRFLPAVDRQHHEIGGPVSEEVLHSEHEVEIAPREALFPDGTCL